MGAWTRLTPWKLQPTRSGNNGITVTFTHDQDTNDDGNVDAAELAAVANC